LAARAWSSVNCSGVISEAAGVGGPAAVFGAFAAVSIFCVCEAAFFMLSYRRESHFEVIKLNH
jgi:hypothetical protein